MAYIRRKGTCLSSCDSMVHLRWQMKDALWWFSTSCFSIKHKCFRKAPGWNNPQKSWSFRLTKNAPKLQIYKSEHKTNIRGSDITFRKAMCFGLSALHQEASAHLFELGKITSKGHRGLNFFHNEQIDGWPFNSAITVLHSISNGGFDNQGHSPETLWIRFSDHGLLKSAAALSEDHLPSWGRIYDGIFVRCSQRLNQLQLVLESLR